MPPHWALREAASPLWDCADASGFQLLGLEADSAFCRVQCPSAVCVGTAELWPHVLPLGSYCPPQGTCQPLLCVSS